ncbi:MAG: NAD-dependent epimerase/dehydratase family protein [Ginsengibacter sp.]
MVIGNGMIANRFINYKNDKDILIFASGVSNSKDTIEQNFQREFELLNKTVKDNRDMVLVYFSTCSIDDVDLKNAPYVVHKIQVEKFIKENALHYYIFRVSNLAGVSNNPYTLLNYFIFNILNKHPFTVWTKARRNIIGIDDMHSIIDYFLQGRKNVNTTINIANPENYPVPNIITCIEEHLNKKALYNELERGDDYFIDISIIKPVITILNIQFKGDYLASLLKKYYHSK